MNEIINTLAKHVEELDKLQGFISKTKEKSGKFSDTVIARLVIEFETKQDVIKEECYSLAEQLQNRKNALRQELHQLQSSNVDNDEMIQDLQLRLEIGALSQNEYDGKMKEISSSLAGYEEEYGQIEDELADIEGVLAGWLPYADVVEEIEEIEEVEEIEEIEEESESSEVDIADVLVPEEESEELPPPPEVQENFEDSFDVGIPEVEVGFEDELVVGSPKEEPEADFPDSPYDLEVGEDLNFDLSDDNFGFEDSVEFSAELIAPDEFSSSIELNIAEDLDESISETNEPRSAMLLRDEGTDSEVVFPFQGENYTIGRAAENNIQIKNDSKVSRKHCRLSRRSNQFYIQDLQSSNGTVVDGELIDEKRLVGGEEIKVGETIFRFSIQ